MPAVPRYDSPQVSSDVLPGVRQSSVASPELFGGGARQVSELGRGVSQVGQVANNIAIDLQERENADMVFRAEAALKDNYLQFEQSVRGRKGQNAWGVTADADKWFADQAKEHTKTLTNDRQRYLFEQQFTKLRQSAMPTIANYESGQRDASLAEGAQASIVGSINMAAAAAGDAPKADRGDMPGIAASPKPFDATPYKSDILKRVQVLSQLQGWSPELRAAKEAEYLTNLHTQIIQSRLDKDPDGAKAYYEANKGEINGTNHDQIEKALKTSGLRETSQAAADAMTAMGMSESEQIDHARKNYSGEEEAAVVAEVKTRFQEQQQASELVQKQAGDRAWKSYSQSSRLTDVSANDIAAMDGKDWEALKAHAREVAKGVTAKTDPTTYYDLRQLAAGAPAEFQKVDLRRYLTKLSPEDFQEFVKLQTNKESIKDAATLDQQLSNTHDLLKWGTDDKEKKGTFDKMVTDAINVEQQRLGKPLDYAQRQSIIDRALTQGEIPGMLWNSDKKLYEVIGKPDDAARWQPKISDEDKSQIVTGFKKKWNREPTKDELMQVYRAWKGM